MPSRQASPPSEPFGDLLELCDLVERFSDCHVVLLGEAIHGTAEFYQARAHITEMLSTATARSRGRLARCRGL